MADISRREFVAKSAAAGATLAATVPVSAEKKAEDPKPRIVRLDLLTPTSTTTRLGSRCRSPSRLLRQPRGYRRADLHIGHDRRVQRRDAHTPQLPLQS